jgi:hypothetical protein
MTALPVSPTLVFRLPRVSRPFPVPRTILALWLAIAVATGVRTVISPTRHTVFPIFATAAAHWWNDQPLYQDYKPLDYFRYPPVFAVFVSPFAALGLRVGGVLWTWLGLAVYAHGVWQFRRDVIPAGQSPRRDTAFFALATAGALAGVWNAQSNALVVGLILRAAAAFARGESRASALWLAIAVALKPSPLPLVLLLCALWPRRLAGWFALTLIAVGLVPFLTRPPAVVSRHYVDWAVQQQRLANERWPGFRDAWTVWQVSANVGGPIDLRAPVDSRAYRLLQAISGLACLAGCLALRLAGVGERVLLLRTLGMGAAWLMLFGPAVEHSTYVFLAPFSAAAAVGFETRPFGRALAVAACALILTFGWGAVSLRLVTLVPGVLAALPVGTALFALGLALDLFVRPRAARLMLPEIGLARVPPLPPQRQPVARASRPRPPVEAVVCR